MSCGRGDKISRGAVLLFPTSVWSRIPDRLPKEREGEKHLQQITKQTPDSKVPEGGAGRGLGVAAGCSCWGGTAEWGLGAVQGHRRAPEAFRGWRGQPEPGKWCHSGCAESSLLSVTSDPWTSEISCHSPHLRQDPLLLSTDTRSPGSFLLGVELPYMAMFVSAVQ